MRTNLRRQLTELDRQEDRYLDLLGDPDWPEQKLKAKMRDVRNNKQRITRQLEESTDTLDPGRAVLTAALDLLDTPRDLYDTATDHARKLLNKAIFARLYVDMLPARQPTVATDDLHEPFGSLMHAIRARDTDQQPQGPQAITHGRQDDAQLHLGGLLASALAGRSASKAAMVGDTYHNANRWVPVRAPEITLRPVGIRQLAAGGTR